VTEALGVDIGGVIMRKMREGDTSFFTGDYLRTPVVPGAFEALGILVGGRFGPRVYLVSKAGPRTQVKTLRWLKHRGFFAATGIKPKHVRFCLERADKHPIAVELRLSHFIDDRLDVLLALKSVPYRYLFEPEPRPDAPRVPRSIHRLAGWDDAVRRLS
jgi:hypothetical protein